GQQQPRTVTVVELRAQRPYGHRQHPRQPQRLRHCEGAQQPRRGAHRRERGEQRVQQRVLPPLPLVELVAPHLTVTRVERRHRGDGGLQVPVEQGGPIVRQYVGEHGGGVPPPQSVPLQGQTADDR